MKATETKSTHSQQHAATDKFSAEQAQERPFFSESTAEQPAFFQPEGISHIQPKLIAESRSFFQPARVPAIQMKCAACEAKEREQSEDLNSERLAVQRMPAFESDEAEVQRQPVPGNGYLQTKPSISTATETSFFSTANNSGFLSGTKTPFFSPAALQAKLTVGKSNDRYEREADQMADRVVQGLGQTNESVTPAPQPTTQTLQTKCDACEREEELRRDEENDGEQLDLQHKLFAQPSGESGDGDENQAPVVFRKSLTPHPAANIDLNKQLSSSKGRGITMPAKTRGEMESAFQADFSNVRIHTDTKAIQMSQSLRAQAFTHGNDIYFNQGKYNPTSREGKHLVAHELTHTLQQGTAVQRRVRRKTDMEEEATERETPDVQTTPLDDARSLGERVFSNVRESVHQVGETVVDTTGNLIRTGQRGFSVAQESLTSLTSLGTNVIASIIERFAPGLMSLLNGGLVDRIEEQIIGGVRSVVGNLLERIRSGELTAQLREILLEVKTVIVTVAAQVAKGDCSSLFKVFKSLRKFAGLLFSPVLNRARELVSQGGAFILNLWNQFGMPAVEAIQIFAGGAWQWIQEKAAWIWEITTPIRSAFGEAWRWIKIQLGLAQDSASSIFETLRQAAVNVWDSIKEKLTPVLGPLQSVAAVMALLSPLGPVLLLYKGAPALWNALKWIWEHLTNWQAFLDVKEIIVNDIIPALRTGFTWLRGALSRANDWVDQQFTALSTAFNEVLEELQTSPLFVTIKVIFGAIKQEFDGLIGAIRKALAPTLLKIKTIVTNVWKCLRPIAESLNGIMVLLLTPALWPTYISWLRNWLFWTLLPEGFKRAAIKVLLNFAIRVVRSLDRAMVQVPGVEVFWPIIKTGLTSFLERVRAKGPDAVIYVIEKALSLAINPRTYSGFFLGVLKGFVWDGLVGLIRLVYDLVTGVPRALFAFLTFLRHLIPDVEVVQQMIARGREIAEQVRTFIQRPDAVQQLIDFIRRSPSILYSMIETVIREGQEKAKQIGAQVASQLFGLISEAQPFNTGFKIGTLVGTLLFEVVLGALTVGGGALAKWGGKAVQWLLRGIQRIGRGLSQGGSLIRKALNILHQVVEAGHAAAQRANEALSEVLQSLKRYLRFVGAWFRRAIRRAIRSLRGATENLATWQRFKVEVGNIARGVGSRGIRERDLFMRVRDLRRRQQYRNVVAGIRRGDVEEVSGWGKWSVKAKRKGFSDVLRGRIATVWMNREERWNYGKQAIEKRMDRLSRRNRNREGIQDVLRREEFRERYNYSSLTVGEYDQRENDWDIVGAMSPKAPIVQVKPMPVQRVQQMINGKILQRTDKVTDVSARRTIVYRVDYGTPPLSNKVKEDRLTDQTTFAGQNVAAFLVDNRERIFHSDPYRGEHAEERGIERITNKTEITAVYSELKPCPRSQKDCMNKLKNKDELPNLTEITYSFFYTYRAIQALKRLVRRLRREYNRNRNG